MSCRPIIKFNKKIISQKCIAMADHIINQEYKNEMACKSKKLANIPKKNKLAVKNNKKEPIMPSFAIK